MPRENEKFPSTLHRSLTSYSNCPAGRIACARKNEKSCARQERMYSPSAATFKFLPNWCCSPTEVVVEKNSRMMGSNFRSRTSYPVSSCVRPQGRPTTNWRLAPTSLELYGLLRNGPDSWNAAPWTVIQSMMELVDM